MFQVPRKLREIVQDLGKGDVFFFFLNRGII